MKDYVYMTKQIDAILLCGGKGRRFRAVTHDKIPKPLYRVNDLELIKFSLNALDFSLINNLIFAVGHHADIVRAWVLEQHFPCNVIFSTQIEPGVLGAVYSALEFVTAESFLICNTDEIRDGMSITELVDYHEKAPHLLATMLTGYSDNLFEHRVITTDENRVVTSSELNNPIYKTQKDVIKQVNAGFVLLRIEAASYFNGAYGNEWSGLIDRIIEEQLMQAILNSSLAYFNVGTVEELEKARLYLATR